MEPQDPYQISAANEQEFAAIDPGWLTEIVQSVLARERVSAAELSLALVDDGAIHEINRRFLNHDEPTDVISFSLGEAGDSHSSDDAAASRLRMDGEIVISVETAARVADEAGRPPHEEIALYLVHGLLHLCGYDDRTAGDRLRMQRRQRTHLQKLGIRPN